MDKIKNDDLAVKSIDDVFDDIATGRVVHFPDADNKPTEQYHCNLKKEPWQYLEKLTKSAVNFNAQNLKQNVTQVKNCRVENTNTICGREM